MEPLDDTIVLTRIDPSRNMERFYRLSVVPALFGGFVLQRDWGRIGTWGQSRSEFCADLEAALARQRQLVAEKHKRGYVVK